MRYDKNPVCFIPFGAIIIFLLAGCAPNIDNINVASGEPGDSLDVTATVTKNQTTIQDVKLDVRPLGDDDFDTTSDMAGSGGAYSGQTPRLVPGEYEARVRVLYKAMFQSAVKTKSATRPFSLSWPPGTFSFETGGLNGWTYAGVFGVSDTFEQCSPQQLASSPYFSVTSAGWPVGINATGGPFTSGSLRVNVSDTCYPASDDEVGPTGVWNFNLNSPDLSDAADWQGISGVSFRINTNNPGTIYAVATVIYEDANGDTLPSSPMTSPTQVDFTQATGQTWLTISKTWDIPDQPIRALQIRIFGQPNSVSGFDASTVLVDVISPIP